MRRPRTWFVIAFVAYALVIRLLPWILRSTGVEIPIDRMVYPWNFAPMTALCLFAGAHFSRRSLAIACPLGMMLVSDALIGVISGSLENAFYQHTLVVYGAFAASVSLGFLLREHRSVWRITGTALAAETLFFLVTNLGVWAGTGMYTADFSGLVTCYTMALPFFRNSLIALAVFTPVAFSSWALLPELTPAPVRVSDRG